MSIPPTQLTCEQCKKRKKRCDKSVPCGACVQASLECTAVQRHRLPRGRSGKKALLGAEVLRERVARLETLVNHIRKQQAVPSDPPIVQPPKAEEQPAVDSFVASDFWTELTETVAGLRDVLELPQDAFDADEIGHDGALIDNVTASTYLVGPNGGDATGFGSRLLFGNEMIATTHEKLLLGEPWLLDIYRIRVDSIFKVLHWPSMLALLAPHSHQQQNVMTLPVETRALVSAINFTATCALFDHELPDRQLLVSRRRIDTEKFFLAANLMTSTNFTLLQAFVIYLAGLRACQATAQQWTLTATAVRLANAQGLPFSAASSRLLIDTEMRRRLWHGICLLDMQSAFDRGSRTIVSSNDMKDTPLHIDDAHLSSMSKSIIQTQERFTDMTFSILVHRAGICQRMMTEIGISAFEGTLDRSTATAQKKTILANYERESDHLVGLCDVPSPSPLQKFTMAVAAESLVAMRLLLYRPLHRQTDHPEPLTEDFEILHVALNVLFRSRDKRSRADFAPWAWFSWVKWYALAVVLAELCTTNRLVDQDNWTIVQACYDDYADAVADSKSGLLWQPIARLMTKVKSMRKDVGQHPQTSTVQIAPADFTWNMENFADNLGHSILHADHSALQQDLAWNHWDLFIDDINNLNYLESNALL